MKIRDAVERDLPAIVGIYNASISQRMATADLEPVPVESRRMWFRAHTPARFPIWVVEVEGEIAGWLSFQLFYGRPAYSKTAEVSVYVAPKYQRRGIGRQLLSRAISQSPALGFKTLIAFIFAHNLPSLQLFEGLGFERWGYLPAVAELDGVERDVVIAGRRIEGGDAGEC
ncbi:MAG: GNAT family N-acetyltransferase [Oscillatoria princeps RMCB-10]|jgi:phosphinothricin acetyltransferase|nr:GNAT family N-acetyltransferase [Oscillatoria princeps RMCB-10]